MAQEEYHSDYLDNRSASILNGVGALLLGVALGATVALFMSQKSGEDIRAAVGGQANNWKDQLAGAIHQGRQKYINAIEDPQKS